MQVALSSIGIIDLNNDSLTRIGGVQGSWTVGQALNDFPQSLFLDKTSLGEDRLCIARIDGMPCVIEATNNSVTYVAVVEDFAVLSGIHTHPIHRPK